VVITIAIIGSGPSGFYSAAALLESGADVQIDIIERLPTPYGLIRGGVAPDHQTTKRVMKTYERSATDQKVRFYGNVCVGQDVSLDELRQAYDAVVLAVGAPFDRPLGIKGDGKKGVIGSASFVGWYNGHPDFRDLDPDLDTKAVAVIGNGNVAIDIARVLVKTAKEMTAADLPDYAAKAIQSSPIRDVYMFGRRGPNEAKFTNVELREMGELEDAHPVVDPAQLPDAVTGEMSDRDRRLRERNLASLREFTKLDPGKKRRRVHFAFYAKPVEVLGGDKVEGLKLERTKVVDGRAVDTGEFFTVDCGLVLPAIGYQGEPLEGAPFDKKGGVVVNTEGRVAPGLFAAGWIKRGPTGVIGTNKPDGDAVAEAILKDGSQGKPGRPALEALLAKRGVKRVDFAAWKKIEAAEIAAASPGSPRRKFCTVADLLAALDG
jgi:NADPH-dependent glutamate synthase beta subunit-like oxidoreductase